MSSHDASRQGEPRLIYRAGPSVLYMIPVGVLLMIFTATMLGGILLALLIPEEPNLVLAGATLVPLLVLGAAVVLLLRPAFRVTTAGVELRGCLSSRTLTWPEIAVIEIDRSLMNRGAVVVVTKEGRRVTSALTGSRYAMRRGESTFDHGPDLLQPARPARAAIDTHRRWLDGSL